MEVRVRLEGMAPHCSCHREQGHLTTRRGPPCRMGCASSDAAFRFVSALGSHRSGRKGGEPSTSYGVKSKLVSTYGFCVDDVAKSGWFYDSSQNLETCDAVAVP